MPARKPSTLIDFHREKETQAQREAAEAALMPKTLISQKPPSALKGHPLATTIWHRLIKLYFEVQGTIVTAFDEQLLTSYCLICEEERELMTKVRELDRAQKAVLNKAKKIKPTKDNFKDWVLMWQQVNGLTANFRGMDARLDGKRKHRLSIEQSLYLTPRSRAGAIPPEKPPEEPKDDMERLLSEG